MITRKNRVVAIAKQSLLAIRPQKRVRRDLRKKAGVFHVPGPRGEKMDGWRETLEQYK